MHNTYSKIPTKMNNNLYDNLMVLCIFTLLRYNNKENNVTITQEFISTFIQLYALINTPKSKLNDIINTPILTSKCSI